MKIPKKKAAGFAAAALALAAIAGSWAYYTSTTGINNNLYTKSYADRTIEEFTPDQKIQPGSRITKKVGVENTGDYELAVRIRMDEKWTRDGRELIGFSSDQPAFGSVVKAEPDYTAVQGNASDGLLTGDESVMYKELDLTDWTAGGDGCWYYNRKLAPGKRTGNLLKSLVMATNADMGNYVTKDHYSTADKAAVAAAQNAYDRDPSEKNRAALETAYAWTGTKPEDESTITFIKSENTLDPAAGGYADANYTLTITTEICQATKGAVQAAWNKPTDKVPPALMEQLN